MIYLFILFILTLLFFINHQFKIFYPSGNKLRVLEYHSVSTNGFEDQITISKEKIIEQFEYLKKNNYNTMWLSDIDKLKEQNLKLPPKTVVLTFDDGFLDNYTVLFPLLKHYGFKAVCFMVLGRIGSKADWNGIYVNDSMKLMNKQQLIEIESHIELGYHTFKHDNYLISSFEDIETDLQLCQEVIAKEGLKVFPVIAYTYGRYFRKKDQKQKRFFDLLNKYGIKYGLRIGNRIAIFPFKSNYEIQRIDIRGFDSFADFKFKLRYGRKKIF